MDNITKQPTPQAIKEAAEKYANEKTKFVPVTMDYAIYRAKNAFIAGATHPETEKCYISLFLDVLKWADDNYSPILEGDETRDGITNFDRWYNVNENFDNAKIYTFADLLQLYREQTTKNKDGLPK
jgi:hypothetical protein